jgi:hypothetical protein
MQHSPSRAEEGSTVFQIFWARRTVVVELFPEIRHKIDHASGQQVLF